MPSLSTRTQNQYSEGDSILEGDIAMKLANSSIKAKKTVEVKGIGNALSGLYFVESVAHTFNNNGYTQTVSVSRDGFGATVQIKPKPKPKSTAGSSPSKSSSGSSSTKSKNAKKTKTTTKKATTKKNYSGLSRPKRPALVRDSWGNWKPKVGGGGGNNTVNHYHMMY